MKAATALTLIGALVAGCAGEGPETTSTGTPLVFDVEGGREVDHGLVLSGDPVEHTFRFRNRTASEIRLVEAFTTCTCTSYRLDRRVWGPGEAGAVHMSVDTLARKGATSAGLSLLLEDAAGVRHLERFDVAATIDVSELLYAEPAALELGAIRRGAESRRVLRVVSKRIGDRDAPDRLRSKARSGSLSLDLVDGGVFQPVDGASLEVVAEVAVELVGDLAPGRFDTRVALEVLFPDGRVREISIPVRGELSSAISLSRPSLFVGGLEAGEVRDYEVMVAGVAADCEVAADVGWLETAWVETDDGSEAGSSRRLRVTVRVPETPGPFRGSVAVRDASNTARLEVAGVSRVKVAVVR